VRRALGGFVAVVVAFVTGTGCAAAARGPDAPAVEVASPPPPPAAPAVTVVAVPPSSFSGAPAAGAPAPRSAARAFMDVVRAQQELEASTGSCQAACRALGAMDSAAGRLCSLAASADDQHECDDSKTKVVAARVRVAGSCGTCAGGTSVDPNAPVPSR